MINLGKWFDEGQKTSRKTRRKIKFMSFVNQSISPNGKGGGKNYKWSISGRKK